MEEMMNTTMNEAIENEVIENTIEESCDSGASLAVAMLIGSGLTLAAIAIGKAAKKAWCKYKAKKEAETQESDELIEAEVEEIDADDED